MSALSDRELQLLLISLRLLKESANSGEFPENMELELGGIPEDDEIDGLYEALDTGLL